MEWKDLEKMTVVKLREEALKFPQIEAVHGKHKEQLMDELAHALGIEKPHVHFSDNVVHTKSELKHQIHQLKTQRDGLVQAHDHTKLHEIRRQIHHLKHRIRVIEMQSARH